MRALYAPSNNEKLSGKLIDAKSKSFVGEWDFAFKVKKVRYYTTDDIKFPTTDTVPEGDLREVGKIKEK